MIILTINDEKNVDHLDKLISQGKDVFILIYMEGCGPCNATRPEWAKIGSTLQHQYASNNNLVVADVNKDYVSNMKYIGSIDGFPTMKYIGNNGKTVEAYENSNINKKDRSLDSFVNWIESKINNVVSSESIGSAKDVYKRISQKRHLKTRQQSKSKNKNKLSKHRKYKVTRRRKHKLTRR